MLRNEQALLELVGRLVAQRRLVDGATAIVHDFFPVALNLDDLSFHVLHPPNAGSNEHIYCP